MLGREERDANEDANVDPAAYKNFEEVTPRRVDPQTIVLRPTQLQAAYPYAPPHKLYDHSVRTCTPPPIATLPAHASPSSASNASSIDGSSVTTPSVVNAAGRLPLPSQPHQQQHQHAPHYTYDMQHFPPGNYVYGPPQPQPPQYTHHPHAHHPHDQRRSDPNAPQHQPPQNGQPQYAAYPPSTGWIPVQGGTGAAIDIVYTDDASTKPSDRVRRRCFNCCTTETATWRRSNLNPGKMLCNKCGLFERTHSRPRPEDPALERAQSRSRPAKRQSHQPYPPPTASNQQQSQPQSVPYPAPISALAGPSPSPSTSTSTSASTSRNNNAITSNGGLTSNGQPPWQDGARSVCTPTPSGASGSGSGGGGGSGNGAPNTSTNGASASASPASPGAGVGVGFLRVAVSAERGTKQF
ncbi:hypothetical protein B0H16DRAFT_384166 [Mycena metata]|uniref:GATA-type domain-containing protein n=1 Tax=Mycena metata TaxID=1033252 RepID=A0AAD7HI27_9AGAR|nr:hypothetical protein B0H16DRAFT_384166 [Mycena metata]